MNVAKNWITVAESKLPWEREALEFVRGWFPNHEPYRAWSNFEFIADDGSINEVDLLVMTPQGLFLIEIKSRPGRLSGDAGTWNWETDGRTTTTDNPLFLANLKAKKLRSLLQRQKACQKSGQIPFVEALVFCSAADLKCELQGNAAFRICLRDRDAVNSPSRDREGVDAVGAPQAPLPDGRGSTNERGSAQARAGICAAIMRRECPGLEPVAKGTHDRPACKLVTQALDQAGIRASQRQRKVGDYVLEQLIGEGPGYQDWQATHTQLREARRRVRLYLVRNGATAEDRQTIQRAALREFQLVETLQHPGVLRGYGYTEHEVGPALIFEHDPLSMRLDHFLAQRHDKLNVTTRLDLMRQIAEVIRFAHDKKVVHRALSPQSILVVDASSDRPRVKVFNWQVGYREGSTSSGVSRNVSATSHVDQLVENASTAYMAPEAFSGDDNTGEHLDVFSLGAIAYHLFSGVPPATNALELSNKLREAKGLQISAVLNGPVESLHFLIQFSTHPDVSLRNESVVDFLSELDDVENELTTPEHESIEDASRAQIGDLLPGNLRVLKRIGQGSCSVAMLVEKDGQEFILKVANDPEHNDRLKGEAAVLLKLRHAHVVEFQEVIELGNRAAFLMRPVFADKEKKTIETLGHRLRTEGRLHVDMLQRFGEDLLDVVKYLEEQGIPHRDIKPENIAVGAVGAGKALHVVLFDFSLSRTSPENIRAGTREYLDPLLPLRKPARWDLHAERYAAAITLYELATGSRPKWGDGTTDPSHLTCEISIEPESFDAGLRDRLVPFFTKALRRDPSERFDNAEDMLRAWRHCFENIAASGPLEDAKAQGEREQLLAAATLDTPIHELGLGTRATNALDRANILTVKQLLVFPGRRLNRLRGVGLKTRKEIIGARRLLRERLEVSGEVSLPDETAAASDALSTDTPPQDVATLGIDVLLELVRGRNNNKRDAARLATMDCLLGLTASTVADQDGTRLWLGQTDVARQLGTTPVTVHQALKKSVERWERLPALTRLCQTVVEIAEKHGGVIAVEELVPALLLERGSALDEPQRSRAALAVTRAAVELERVGDKPRLFVRRSHDRVLIALDPQLLDYALELGRLADELANADPLVAPQRTLELLREIPLPQLAEPRPSGSGSSSKSKEAPLPDGRGSMIQNLTDHRLVRLAAAASQRADVSSRHELYPRGMDALRALKLSQGAVAPPPNKKEGRSTLTIEQLSERVRSRYPYSEPLPSRPQLDQLLRAAGFTEWLWDPVGDNGRGCYATPPAVAGTTGSESIQRFPTSMARTEATTLTPEEADARLFEERLQRAAHDGAFLTLLVNHKDYQQATDELTRRFPIQLVDFEGLFLDALREVAAQAKVDWNLVVQTDATPGLGDWDKLTRLVGRAITNVEQQLAGTKQTMLVVYAGLLARYDRMDLLERLRDNVGRRDGIHGLWLLAPGSNHAMLDGKAIPLISPGQRVPIPPSWLANIHRSR